MEKINNEGLEKLKICRNALNSMYDKLEPKGVFNDVQEEFQYISETLGDAEASWDVISDDGNQNVSSVIINGKIYEQVGE